MSKTRLSTWSPKQRHVWQHNGFKGHARMMQLQALAIMKSESATQESKDLARNIWSHATELAVSLETRIDPWKEEK